MALNTFQKITRVLPSNPFGTYADGDYSSATAPTMTYRSCSGTSGTSTLTLGTSGFTNGDLIIIYQVRGTGAGQWEVNQISSGGGSTSLTLATTLQYTYTDSGSSQAQVIKIPQYNNVTVQAGTWTPTAWAGDTGGILAFACNSLTPTGTISVNSSGFTGGAGSNSGSDNTHSSTGEGSSGASVSNTRTRNGSGGGGGSKQSGNGWAAAGGGGANGGAGSTGGNTSAGLASEGGSSTGDTNLQSIFFGGGGGGGRSWSGGTAGTGGAGGGIIIIFAKTLYSPTSITSTGANGGTTSGSSSSNAGAGGGAGGSILICSQVADIGTDKLTTTAGSGGAGSGGSNNNTGGAGGKGRIAVYYGASLSGSISSSLYETFTNELDATLIESSGLSFPIFFGNTAIA